MTDSSDEKEATIFNVWYFLSVSLQMMNKLVNNAINRDKYVIERLIAITFCNLLAVLGLLSVVGVAQWLGFRSLAGGLTLLCARPCTYSVNCPLLVSKLGQLRLPSPLVGK